MVKITYDVSGVSGEPPESRSGAPPARLPSLAAIERKAAALRGNPGARRWLHSRGLSEKTIQYWRLGFEERSWRPRTGALPDHPPAITIPLFDNGYLVNLKRRYLDGEEPRYRALSGRRGVLYPHALRRRCLVLCEGEFDALIAQQQGLPAVAGTMGIHGWDDAWNASFVGRSVALVFDSGMACFALAQARAEQLIRAGAEEAWAVELGLADGEDLTDWFVTYGRTAAELRAVISAARRARHG